MTQLTQVEPLSWPRERGGMVVEGYLTSAAAARRIRISKSTLLRAVKRGVVVVAARSPAGQYRFRPADLEAYQRGLAVPGAGHQRRAAAISRTRLADAPPPAPASGTESAVAGDLLALLAESLDLRAALLLGVSGEIARFERGADQPREQGGQQVAEVEVCRLFGAQALAEAPCLWAAADPVPTTYLPGDGALTCLPLYHAHGALYGMLCAYRRVAQPAQEHEIAMLRLAGRGLVRAAALAEARVRDEPLVREAVALKMEGAPAYLATMVSCANDAIIGLALDRTITNWNAGAERLFGYTASEVVGRPNAMLIVPGGPDEAPAALDEVRQGRSVVFPDTLRQAKDGRAVPVSISVAPVLARDGTVVGAVAIAYDITARKQAEEALRESAARWQVQYMSNPVPVYTWQAVGDDWELVAYNEAARVTTGGAAATLLGRRARDLYKSYPDVMGCYERCTRRHLTQRLELSGPLSSTGVVRDLVITLAFAPPDLVLVYTEDITERKQAEAALRASEARMRAIVETAADGIITINEHGTIETFNAAAERLFGYNAEEILGQNICLLMPQSYRATYHHYLAHPSLAETSGTGGLRHEVEGLCKDGSTFPLFLAVSDMQVGGRRLFTAILRDLTAQNKAVDDLRYMAMHDALTGLPNRTLLQDRISQALATAERNGTPLALLILDLDRFKEVNDTFGHHTGDAVLREVAHRLKGAVRAQDTVARLGGDEFALVLPGADATVTTAAVTRIEQVLSVPIAVHEVSVLMEASIGIAVFPDHGRDGETLHRHADVAMYAAKHAGLRAQVYDPAHNIYTPQRLALIEDLRSAIREGTLALYFQPQVHMRSGEVVGAEALARWRHPTRGFVPPDEFVRIAEQTGQIAALTAWVLECAMQQAARWSGSLGRAVRISVNISAAQLRDILLCDHIAALLALYGVEACQLRLEVTESALMVDPELSRATVARLASMGIGISVDDYGTCYSSLAYLKRLAVDELKIDRVFVREVGTDRTDAVIVASTVELAHELGLRVVAEGVEDARTWAAVAELGCDVAQGYFLSRPLPADEMERWLRAAGARQHPEGDGALFAHPQWHEA